MRILTIGPSPYLLARDGRIHKDVILAATKAGHTVESVVYHHDVRYFLPTETGKHIFQNVPLHPFLGQKGEIAPFAFETMKTAQPAVVVSIGDYEDTEWLWSIKAIYPHLFKWVAIVPSGTNIVNESYQLAMAYADKIVVTTASALEAFSKVKTDTEHVAYGPDHQTFFPLNKPLPEKLNLLNMGKNIQISNVPAFMKAVAQTDCTATVHTNVDDSGDYNLRRLVKRYDLEKRLGLPIKYVSIREGLSDSLVNELYNSHHAVVDCSLQSATALTMLEAMATGCVPIGMEFGATGEVLAAMPKDFRFTVPFETIMGPKEEELAVISVKELVRSIENIHRSCLSDHVWLEEARRVSAETARFFSKDLFATRINEILETIVTCQSYLAVDSF